MAKKKTNKKVDAKTLLGMVDDIKTEDAPAQKEVRVKEATLPKEVNKGGRPSDKDDSITYKKLTISIPQRTVLRLQIAVPKLRVKGILKTQNALVDTAIKEYLDKNKDLLAIE